MARGLDARTGPEELRQSMRESDPCDCQGPALVRRSPREWHVDSTRWNGSRPIGGPRSTSVLNDGCSGAVRTSVVRADCRDVFALLLAVRSLAPPAAPSCRLQRDHA